MTQITTQSDAVLVCSTCGKQHEIPLTLSSRNGWYRCTPPCKGTTFSLRMRAPLVKSEPHP
jgi:hypothetical protein